MFHEVLLVKHWQKISNVSGGHPHPMEFLLSKGQGILKYKIPSLKKNSLKN
jgi:hypothetical protein